LDRSDRKRRDQIRALFIFGVFLAFVCLILWASNTHCDESAPDLGTGILRWKLATANGLWWSCGEAQKNPEIIANEIAQTIKQETMFRKLNPWELAAIMAKESKFDECAIGKGTRDWAYEKGLLKPSRQTISHNREDILKVLGNPAWKQEQRKADLGIAQMMWPTVYSHNPRDLLYRSSSIRIAAEELAKRRSIHERRTRRPILWPSALWPGWFSAKYKKSIQGHARALMREAEK
jgi:hypothetical protein